MSRIATYLSVILQWRRLIIINTLVVTLLVLAVSYILPRRYTAVAQLLPPNEEGDLFGLTSILGGGVGGGLSRLRLGAFGSATGASEIMAGILTSRTVMDRVAEICSVAYYYRINPVNTEKTRKQLARMTRVSVTDEGIVRIAVEAKNPQLAAKVANCYISELDQFLRTSNISRGRNMRLFLEKRLQDVQKTLAAAQESLTAFQVTHKVVAVDEETRAAIDAYARLKSQAYLKQAELDAVRDIASPDNPYFLNLQREVNAFLDQLRRLEQGGGRQGFGVGFAVDFSHLPSIGAEFARRYRDYRIQEETYAMLYQQYEYAKVLEARDAPTLTVLDYAVPPQRHSFPRRGGLVIAAFLFSFGLSVLYAFANEYFQFLQNAKPAEYEKWYNLRQEFKSALAGFLRIKPLRRHS
ncbi:MAG: Wzz/FepE/Etk N-terminal domain-containing protein [candidate division WOR-3 bacterium]